jgi:hypothetical protein
MFFLAHLLQLYAEGRGGHIGHGLGDSACACITAIINSKYQGWVKLIKAVVLIMTLGQGLK